VPPAEGQPAERASAAPGLPSSGPLVYPLIPGYEILEELGRGGMGVVYKARQVKANRLVALKMILAQAHASVAEKVRFQIEAEAVARLQHPHIVPLYEVGEHDGLPFFTLEFCEGGSLDRKLEGQPLAAREAAALLEQLARAMHYAHSRGVVHRDLKPANVLLTADGTPKITDFGLAKQLDAAGPVSQSGAIVGTPEYMAPEQAEGRGRDISGATDVWALGVLLYELLTGRRPFHGADTFATLRQVLQDEPLPPSRHQPKTPRDLETICLKCLRKEPEKRYRTAEALADDLRRFLAGEPIEARPAGRLERAWKWSRRRPALAALVVVSLLAVVGVVGLAVGLAFALRGEKEARGLAEAKEKETNETLAKQKGLLSASARTYCELSDREFKQGNVRDSLNWMLRAYETAPLDDPLRPSYLRLIAGQRQGLERRLGHDDAVLAVAISLDGCTVLTGSRDNTARLWDTSTGNELHTLRHGDWVLAVAFSPDGRTALTGSSDNAARLWDATTGQLRATLRHDHAVSAVAFSPAGRTALTGSNRTARLWDTASGKLLQTVYHDAKVDAVAVSPDGHTALTGSFSGRARLWDTATGKEIATLPHGRPVRAVTFSPDGRAALTGSEDAMARLWDTATGKELHTLRHDHGVTAVAFSPDGRTAVTGSVDRTARLWDAASGKLKAALRHSDSVLAVAFNPDSRTALTGSADKTARLWNAASGNVVATFYHDSEVNAVAFSADGRSIVTGSWDKFKKKAAARLWDIASTQEILITRHDGPVFALALSPDGRTALTGSDDKTARLWDAASSKPIATLRHTDRVACVTVRCVRWRSARMPAPP
jgi:WD40 repeat protein/tRNA A-37 threonylcarbamoyl transferase component Bud32